MSPLLLGLFLSFAACCAAQVYLVRQVRVRLASRHPDVWLAMSARTWSQRRALHRFIWRRGDIRLGDPVLTRRTRLAFRTYLSGIGIWLLYAVVLFSGAGLHRR